MMILKLFFAIVILKLITTQAKELADGLRLPQKSNDDNSTGFAVGNCQDYCGRRSPDGCYCDSDCYKYGDCCDSFSQECLDTPQYCKSFCEWAVGSCGARDGFVCNTGGFLQYFCAGADYKWRNDCVIYAQYLADVYCEPGDASNSCPFGPDYSFGDCISDLECNYIESCEVPYVVGIDINFYLTPKALNRKALGKNFLGPNKLSPAGVGDVGVIDNRHISCQLKRMLCSTSYRGNEHREWMQNLIDIAWPENAVFNLCCSSEYPAGKDATSPCVDPDYVFSVNTPPGYVTTMVAPHFLTPGFNEGQQEALTALIIAKINVLGKHRDMVVAGDFDLGLAGKISWTDDPPADYPFDIGRSWGNMFLDCSVDNSVLCQASNELERELGRDPIYHKYAFFTCSGPAVVNDEYDVKYHGKSCFSKDMATNSQDGCGLVAAVGPCETVCSDGFCGVLSPPVEGRGTSSVLKVYMHDPCFFGCEDSFDCTADRCTNNECVHKPDHSLCGAEEWCSTAQGCISMSSVSCPCFTKEEVDLLVYPQGHEYLDCSLDAESWGHENVDFWLISDDSVGATRLESKGKDIWWDGDPSCFMYLSRNHQVPGINPPYLREMIHMSENEHLSCEYLVALSGAERGFECFLSNSI